MDVVAAAFDSLLVKEQRPALESEYVTMVDEIEHTGTHSIVKIHLLGKYETTGGLLFGPPDFMKAVRVGDKVEGCIAKRWGACGLVLSAPAPYLPTGGSPSMMSPTSPAEVMPADLIDLDRTEPKDAAKATVTADTGLRVKAAAPGSGGTYEATHDKYGLPNPPPQDLKVDIQGQVRTDLNRHLLASGPPIDMVGKTIHFRVTKPGNPGEAKLICATQTCQRGGFTGAVRVTEAQWASNIKVFYMGMDSTQKGDYVADGKVELCAPEAGRMYVLCVNPLAPVEAVVDVTNEGIELKDHKIRLWKCQPDAAAEDGQPDSTTAEASAPAGEKATEPGTGATPIPAQDAAAKQADNEELQRNVRQRVDNPVGAALAAATANFGSNPMAPPPGVPAQTRPSPTSYTYDDSIDRTEATAGARPTAPGLENGAFVHVVSLEEMKQFRSLVTGIMEMVDMWSQRRSVVGPAAATATASSSAAPAAVARQHQ